MIDVASGSVASTCDTVDNKADTSVGITYTVIRITSINVTIRSVYVIDDTIEVRLDTPAGYCVSTYAA